MEAAMEATAMADGRVSNWTLKAGYILSAVPILFLLADGIMKLFKPAVVAHATVELGYNESVIVPLGLVLVSCTILYMIPRTAVLGAVLLTGYLGGAVAAHVRMGGPTFSVIFPVIVGLFIWGGLYLRDARIAELLPLRTR